MRRRHGIWVVIVGAMLMLGVHGNAWGIYHVVRALGFFLGHH